MTAPDFREFLKIEEGVLAARLRAVRAAIEHAGEKGRGLEHHAIALLREMLPHEYGLATGFIAHAVTAVGVPARVDLSPQCDVIIFDAVRGAPIVNLGSSQVVPIESVFAAVEVKAAFDPDAHRVVKWSQAIKQLTLRHYVFHEDRDTDPAAEGRELVDRVRAQAGAMSVGGFRAVIAPDQRRTWAPPLTFALAFEYGGGREPSLDAARERLAASLGSEGHLDGLLVPGSCALWSDDAGGVEGTKDEALATWRYRLVSGLSSFPRPGLAMTPDLRPYFGEYVLAEPGPPVIVPRW